MKEGAILARLLNQAAAEPLLRSEAHAVEQVAVELMAMTEEFSPKRAALVKRLPPGELTEAVKRMNARMEKLQQKLEQFNALLRPHTWQVELVGWNAKGIPIFGDFPTSTEAHEMAVLIELARAQLLDRLRKCARCGTWFFARRPRAKFCSTLCRKAEFRSTDEFQKQNKKYQKNYYRDNLSPNQEYYKKGLEPAAVRELKRKRKNRVTGKRKNR